MTYPPYGGPPPYDPYRPVTRPTNGMAIAALVVAAVVFATLLARNIDNALDDIDRYGPPTTARPPRDAVASLA